MENKNAKYLGKPFTNSRVCFVFTIRFVFSHVLEKVITQHKCCRFLCSTTNENYLGKNSKCWKFHNANALNKIDIITLNI